MRLNQKLSEKQVLIINYIENYVNENGISPTIEDVRIGCKLSSKSVVSYNLNILEENIQLSKTNSIKESIYKDSQIKGVNFGKLMQFLRISLVGDLSGPDVFFIIKIVGKDVTLRRLNLLLEKIQKQWAHLLTFLY